MASRILAIGTVAVLTTVAAFAAVSTFRHTRLHQSVTPGLAGLHSFGSRGNQGQNAASAKFDGALADLARHAALVRPDHALQDLRTLAPAARFKQSVAGAPPLVLIDAVTRGDPQQLKAALVELGLQRPAVYSNDVGGWLPVAQLDAAAARAEVNSLRAAMSRTRTGAVTSQGDFAQHSDVARSANSLTGAGVTVGILSDSYDCYSVYATNHVAASGPDGYASNGFLATAATDISTGDLPAGVTVLEEADCMGYDPATQLPLSDEGRAMLQIVHDVAPGAGLAFYTGDISEADFANGIGKLAAPVASGGAGAKVIADDLSYFDEPFYQDGILAQAVDTVQMQGVAYFSAAGNDGMLAYENATPSFNTTASSGPNAGEKLLNFDVSGATTTTSLPVTIAALPPGDFVAVVVQWDQPYVTGAPGSGGATSQIDVCVSGAPGTDVITDNFGNSVNCTGANTVGTDPYQIMIVANLPTAGGNSAAVTLNISVGLANGTTAPGRIKVAIEDDGARSTINAFPGSSASPTIQGHAGAAGAGTVGAAFYFYTPACLTTPATLEPYSSEGGSPILFATNGTRLTTPMVRQKPDFVGPDGPNDTFLGETLASGGLSGGLLNTTIAACQNNPSYPNFFGTSAATPHVAGIAALMLEANPAATPIQIYGALQSSALAMATPSPSFDSGYGFVQADTALVVPVMSLGVTAVPAGGSTTLTWSTIDATGCVASGNWTGAMAPSGSQTVSVPGPGLAPYTLTCTNAGGKSAASTVTLAGVAPSAPTIALSATTIDFGQSSTITWSSQYATSCTAAGSWSGALATSGSEAVTPTASGTSTYSLTCANADGPSPSSSATLTVLAPPAAPTLTLAATSIVVDSSTSITWSSVNATGCTASGSWSGALATSGTQTVTPTAAGTATYTLICANGAGNSPASTATLTITAAPSKSGGGGIDVMSVFALALLGFARIMRLRPRLARGLRPMVNLHHRGP